MNYLDRNTAYVELQNRGYNRSAVENSALLDALEKCIQPDPRIAAVTRVIDLMSSGSGPKNSIPALRAALRGES